MLLLEMGLKQCWSLACTWFTSFGKIAVFSLYFLKFMTFVNILMSLGKLLPWKSV